MNNGRRTLQQGDTVVWPAVGRYKFQSLTPCLTYYRKFTENNVGKATILALFFWIKQQYALLSNNSFEKHFGFKLNPPRNFYNHIFGSETSQNSTFVGRNGHLAAFWIIRETKSTRNFS